MDLANFLLKLSTDILRSMTSEHHIIIFSLLAYFIRYSSGNSCYDESKNPRTCITAPVNAAQNREISSTNTCGNPVSGYCYIGPERKCQLCDASVASLSHIPKFMVDRFSLNNVTWWQSDTWWTSNQKGLSQMFNPLKVNITLDINKMYLISGGIYVTFKTERPKQMMIEKSRDFGKTWQVYQYFAKNCRSRYNLQPDPLINPTDPFKETCSELYSGEFPRSGGVVHFDPRRRYKPSDYYNKDVHQYLEATNIRLRLEYPGTDGREYINEESTLNQYYYAITDLRVDARCDCNGHGEFCDRVNNKEVCDCQHFTMGDDCEICMPLYRNRIWMAGNATHANPCEKCQCFEHATSCTYSNFLNQGICDNCLHNTRGIRCDQCIERFFRNVSVSLNNPNVCIPCNCYAPGIVDDGKCLQTQTLTQQLGQCNCKPGIYGRRCDECLPGKWGFVNPPIGTCFECACNMFGTLNNNQICDQASGQCTCKAFTTGRICDTCKDGYYKFPTVLGEDCLTCPCNVGGSLPACDKNTGICACRPGVMSGKCDVVKPGFFFPNFTYVKYEPELSNANGTFSWYYLVRNYARFFTGLGYAKLEAGQEITFQFEVPVSARFFLMIRYSLYQLEWFSQHLPSGREAVDWTGIEDMQLYLKENDRPNQWLFSLRVLDSLGTPKHAASFSLQDLKMGNAQTWLSSSWVQLNQNTKYMLSFVYEATSNNYGDPWPFLFDSFILMLDYSSASYFSSMSLEVMRVEVTSCFQDSRALDTTYNLPQQCAHHTFTIDLQIYKKALECDCHTAGSVLWNTCETYGGQCQCKEGYGDRRCDQCLPGYYGNPSSGCLACRCSEMGSLSNACNQQTGQCTCKQNAHNLKCDECLMGYFFLSETNPKGCQECFGYGHLTSCTSAVGFIRSYVTMEFRGSTNYQGWRLISADGKNDLSSSLIKTPIGMEYTVQTSVQNYFSAPPDYLGDQLHSYGQLLVVEMSIYPIALRLATNVHWHVRLVGNGQTALFKFMQDVSKAQTTYTVRLHQNYMVNITKLTEFEFKAMLGQLTSLDINVLYYEAPVTVTIQRVKLYTATYNPTSANASLMLNYIEHAQCLKGYTGYSCESCAEGYTRVIPNGGPLVNCVPCSCNNRSKTCDPQSGVCTHCMPGTTGSFCEKCMENVHEPNCDRCKDGYYGMFKINRGCKPCDCYLPGTDTGSNNICNHLSGQCHCNKTLNVGGRKCNVCKENSYNISLGDELRCQECPTCYGLIEDSVLQVRLDISQTAVEISKMVATLSSMQITPFYQEILSLQNSVTNITEKSKNSKLTVTGLDFLWRTLGDKINVFLSTLKGSTTTKINTLLSYSNNIITSHNITYNQYALVYRHLIDNCNLLENTVRARMEQHNMALTQLNNLGVEMKTYLTQATTTSNNALNKKYDLKQKIQLSIDAASQAAKMAQEVRIQAFNLTAKLTPVYARAVEVRKYAEHCVGAIDAWLINATSVLDYAKDVQSTVVISLPDHSMNISKSKGDIMQLTNQFNTMTSQLNTLSRDITTIAFEITKLRQMSLHITQISFAQRTAGRYFDNLRVHQDKALNAQKEGMDVEKEAKSMLNTVQNFMTVATEAQRSAMEMLKEVDSVKASVDAAQSITLTISKQLIGPKAVAANALQTMQTAKNLNIDEKAEISQIFQEAVQLRSKSEDAKALIVDQTIRQYIVNYLTPLVTQCTDYTTRTSAALASAKNALMKSEDAMKAAQTTAQNIQVLSASVKMLKSINVIQLDGLNQSIIRVRSSYAALDLQTGINKLKDALAAQKNKAFLFRQKNIALRTKIEAYKELRNSLTQLSC